MNESQFNRLIQELRELKVAIENIRNPLIGLAALILLLFMPLCAQKIS